jgi:hypothetical protein
MRKVTDAIDHVCVATRRKRVHFRQVARTYVALPSTRRIALGELRHGHSLMKIIALAAGLSLVTFTATPR